MGARSAAASVVRHVGGAAAEAFLVAALVATVALAFSPVYAPAKFLAGTDNAFAAKGGGGKTPVGTSSIVLDQAGQALAFGDTVTFTSVAVGLSGNEHPMVRVSCFAASDGTTLLYRELSTPDYAFHLGGGWSLWWTDRVDATCVGELYSYQTKGGNTVTWLASTLPFAAAGS